MGSARWRGGPSWLVRHIIGPALAGGFVSGRWSLHPGAKFALQLFGEPALGR
jgi:hypothetical protein